MAKNDLLLLDSILEKYISNGIPSKKPDEVFEFFASEQILKDYAFSTEQILSGCVDGRNDGGIDEFFVLVNGHLAENIPEFFWPKSGAELDVYLITCKHDDSFKQTPITTMIPSLIELLDFSVLSENLSDSYNQKVLEKREIFISTYKRIAPALTKFEVHIIFACRGDEDIESNIQAKANQAVDICHDSFSDCHADFSFWGNSKFLSKYRENVATSLELKYEQQCINQDGQYILLAKLDNYYDFITTSDGKLNKKLFDANVRDYLGLNPVNLDISKSLEQKGCADFWWLNNGITIIGSQAHIVGNAISIENVKIVNGLQTSECIFHYFSEHPSESDARMLLIKILITNDLKICNDIIYATNNQTNVNVAALRATDKIQYDIEQILKNNAIYYERRTNYYKNQGIPESAIITPLSLAAGYICLIYKNPYIATSLKQKFMRNDQKYAKVFSENVDLNIWVIIAKLTKKTDDILRDIKTTVGNNTAKFLKNYRHLVMFVTMTRLSGSFSFNEQQLIKFDLDRYTMSEVQKSMSDLREINTHFFSGNQKLRSSTYTQCFKYMANKYGLKDISAIQTKNRKLKELDGSLENLDLSDQIINDVYSELPKQPWPVGIHKQIATKLGLKEITVSNAISFLIYNGKVFHQIYGYVFDTDDNVIGVSDHFGHTESEARSKLKQQKSLEENKFGF